MDLKNEIICLLERMDATTLMAIRNVLLSLSGEEGQNGQNQRNNHRKGKVERQ